MKRHKLYGEPMCKRCGERLAYVPYEDCSICMFITEEGEEE